MMLDWVMADGSGKLKEDTQQWEECRHHSFKPAWKVENQRKKRGVEIKYCLPVGIWIFLFFTYFILIAEMTQKNLCWPDSNHALTGFLCILFLAAFYVCYMRETVPWQPTLREVWQGLLWTTLLPGNWATPVNRAVALPQIAVVIDQSPPPSPSLYLSPS